MSFGAIINISVSLSLEQHPYNVGKTVEKFDKNKFLIEFPLRQ